jgi:hypothetical protein
MQTYDLAEVNLGRSLKIARDHTAKLMPAQISPRVNATRPMMKMVEMAVVVSLVVAG